MVRKKRGQKKKTRYGIALKHTKQESGVVGYREGNGGERGIKGEEDQCSLLLFQLLLVKLGDLDDWRRGAE